MTKPSDIALSAARELHDLFCTHESHAPAHLRNYRHNCNECVAEAVQSAADAICAERKWDEVMGAKKSGWDDGVKFTEAKYAERLAALEKLEAEWRVWADSLERDAKHASPQSQIYLEGKARQAGFHADALRAALAKFKEEK